MRHFALASVLLLASAQLGLAAIHNVTVGGTGVLKFNPQSVNAVVGDIIRFSFQQKNHTVTQSSLEQPCQPLRGVQGFDSKFVPVEATRTGDFPTAELVVRDTNPIWAYCRQGNHCTSGMVFAVNPRDANQLAAFQAAATQGTPSSSPSPTVSSSSAPVPTGTTNHKIVVGGPGVLAFVPANITAQPGDTITFEFHQKNHTVTASSFEFPCNDLSSTGQPGFDSGYKPVGDGATDFPTYSVKVNDTKPIWAFCKQGNHCSAGMVFSANANEASAKNFAAFQALAKGGTGSTTGYPPTQSSAAWRPSSSMAVVLGLFAATFLL